MQFYFCYYRRRNDSSDDRKTKRLGIGNFAATIGHVTDPLQENSVFLYDGFFGVFDGESNPKWIQKKQLKLRMKKSDLNFGFVILRLPLMQLQRQYFRFGQSVDC